MLEEHLVVQTSPGLEQMCGGKLYPVIPTITIVFNWILSGEFLVGDEYCETEFWTSIKHLINT